jgi:putative solute:sodium symporter small subunit
MSKKDQLHYWRKNLQYLVILLIIWFLCSFGLGIIWADEMNTIKFGGFKMGFWFAQQGSIYIFIVLIWVYVFLMNRLDKQFNVDEKE